jgi:hypothetical protein
MIKELVRIFFPREGDIRVTQFLTPRNSPKTFPPKYVWAVQRYFSPPGEGTFRWVTESFFSSRGEAKERVNYLNKKATLF